MKKLLLRGWMLAALVILSAGCPKNEFVPPPPPSVTVAAPAQRDVTVYSDFPGRTDASDTVDINARVRGFLLSTEFTDGEMVQDGQLLFTIEPEQYKAALDTANASRAQATASKELAEAAYLRKAEAARKQAVSELDVLAAAADRSVAEAAVLAADAAIIKAELDLSYTKVLSPVTGRIGEAKVSDGNLVGGLSQTLLTSIVVDDPLNVYFNLDERTALPYLSQGRIGGEHGENAPEFLLELADGNRHPKSGRFDYVDPNFDPDTGTVLVRGVLDNPDGTLMPGMFVRVLIPRELEKVLLVPDLAIQRDLAGSYVLIVNGENEVESRYIQPGPRVEAERVIEEGLEGGERIIVKGIQRARPGIKVTVEAEADTDSPDGGA